VLADPGDVDRLVAETLADGLDRRLRLERPVGVLIPGDGVLLGPVERPLRA
jgi:hypothetical protein